MSLVKISTSKYKYNIDSDKETSKQIATSPREIDSIIVTSGGSAMAVRIYDSASGVVDNKESILIAANAGESVPYTPVKSIPFTKGIYVVIEQGQAGGGEVFLQIS